MFLENDDWNEKLDSASPNNSNRNLEAFAFVIAAAFFLIYKNGAWQTAGLTKIPWWKAWNSDHHFLKSFEESGQGFGQRVMTGLMKALVFGLFRINHLRHQKMLLLFLRIHRRPFAQPELLGVNLVAEI